MKGVVLGFAVVVAFILAPCPVLGQACNFNNFNIEDGMAQSTVLDICEDQFGNLWIATQGGGISKFDGLRFRNITIRDGLSSNYVRKIIADSRGTIWVATAGGISKILGKNIKNYTFNAEDGAQNSVNELQADQEGGIWFSAPNGGLGYIDRRDSIRYFNRSNGFVDDKVIEIERGHDGALWIVTAVRGLYLLKQGKFERILGNDELKGFILTLYVDDDNTLWAGTNRGLIRFKNEQNYQFVPVLNGVFIKSITKHQDKIWLVSAFGVLKLTGGDIRSYRKQEGFTLASVNKVFKDREGNIWLGTNDEGLYKYQGEVIVHYDHRHQLSDNWVTAVTEDAEGNIWFGTNGAGLDKLEGEQFVNYSTKNGLPNNYITSSTRDRLGNLWFGTKGNGIIKYDGKEFYHFNSSDGLVFDAIRCLYADKNNHLWIGTVNGLSHYDGRDFENFGIRDGLYDNVIWNFFETDRGLHIVTRKGFNLYHQQQLRKGYYNEEIFSHRLNVAVQDKFGGYWIGYSGHGIVRVVAGSDSLQTITVEDGLTSDLILSLTFDAGGSNLLVGSERGIDKIQLDGSGNIRRIKRYNKEGYSDLRTIHNSTFLDSQENIWFGSPRGVFKYQPQEDIENLKEPKTYISGVYSYFKETDWQEYSDSSSAWYDIPFGLALPYNQNNLIVEYFGNSLKNPVEVSYKFRLLGQDENWSPVTNKREAVYTNLAPGKYTFQVLAANADGYWVQEPASFSFMIVPPIWQEPWFYLLAVTILVVGTKFFYDYRVRMKLKRILTIEKIRSEEMVKVRKRMARDFHDNMGNQLASITVFTNLINMKLKNRTPEIDELLKKIEKHTKSLFNGTKDFIWSIDPESDNLSEVFTYIKDFGEELFAKTDIIFYSDADDLESDHIALPGGWSRQIVLIFKEAMTNALKHADCTEVHLDLELRDTEFVMKFRDNGKGIEEECIKGNGLNNMRSRADQINCGLEISNHRGAEVALRGSLKTLKKQLNEIPMT